MSRTASSAYDVETLDEVFHFNIGSAIRAPAMTFSVNGKQYVGILVGAIPNSNQIDDFAIAEAIGRETTGREPRHC